MRQILFGENIWNGDIVYSLLEMALKSKLRTLEDGICMLGSELNGKKKRSRWDRTLFLKYSAINLGDKKLWNLNGSKSFGIVSEANNSEYCGYYRRWIWSQFEKWNIECDFGFACFIGL